MFFSMFFCTVALLYVPLYVLLYSTLVVRYRRAVRGGLFLNGHNVSINEALKASFFRGRRGTHFRWPEIFRLERFLGKGLDSIDFNFNFSKGLLTFKETFREPAYPVEYKYTNKLKDY